MKSDNSPAMIAFDADDTLWVNEPFYRQAETILVELLHEYLPAEQISRQLYEREVGNLAIFGYGAKAFTLSMIETAVELSNGKIGGREIQRIIDVGRELIQRPVQLLPAAREVVTRLSLKYPLMLITKGDLFDQESKIARSGLSEFFRHVEIVSEKNSAVYREILKKHSLPPPQFLMVGNSLRSDVLPVLEAGGRAVHIPYEATWEHERVAEDEAKNHHYFRLKSLQELPDFLDQLG